MKPFNLDSVLKYRRQLEEIAQQKLFQLFEKKAQILAAISKKKQEYDDDCDYINQLRVEGVIIETILLFENRINFILEEIQGLHNNLKKMETKITNQRKALLKASQDKKVMEKLKERQNTNYKKYLDKKEAILLDEISVLHHGRG